MKVNSFATLAFCASLAAAGSVQLKDLKVPEEYAENKDAVVTIFKDAFAAYQKFAFGHDDVKPVSGSFLDSRNGWGASVADALGTMIIMGLDDLYAIGLNHTSKIDFSTSKTDSTVSVFETTIRYVGGMLSAYELGGKKDKILVQKAQEVADKLAFAWVGNNAMPFGFVDFSTNTPNVDNSNIAEAGTLIMEWDRLSQYTGNSTYLQLAEKSMRAIATRTDTLLPGLAGQGVDPRTGEFTSKYITWGGASDSYFEYLIKYARLTNNADTLWVETWKTAVDSTLKSLAKRTSVGNWLMIGDMDNDSSIRYVGSHLACFHGGNFILGGKLLNNDTIVKAGLELTDACINTYTGTATGIGPETFAFIPTDSNSTDSLSLDEVAFNQKNGYYITNGQYILRPEVMESNFYAWRATGDKKYLDNAAKFIKQLSSIARVSSSGGYAALNDVNQPDGGGYIDDTESFFFAEVLKYLYLTFDDPSHISLDEWTFNTESHPFQSPEELSSYDPSTPTQQSPPPPQQTTPANCARSWHRRRSGRF